MEQTMQIRYIVGISYDKNKQNKKEKAKLGISFFHL